jgi:DnaJ like chaperone protein
MNWAGKLLGGVIGLLVTRGPLGAVIGVIIGHLFDQQRPAKDAPGGPEIERAAAEPGDANAIAERFFRTTFEVMGHVAKADGRVSEAEIAAARAVMAELRLDAAQTESAIAAYRRGKEPDFNLEAVTLALRKACAGRPDLLLAFLEIQVRAALQGSDMRGAVRQRLGRIATLFGIGTMEFAHLEAVLRLRAGQGARGGAARQANDSEKLADAYRVLEVEPAASDADVEKAYRRQLSRHHPDKLKANGLPESMLEHAKQRTQQIIEAWDVIRARRGIAS